MDTSTILGLVAMAFGVFFLLVMGGYDFFRRDDEPSVWDWLMFPESTFLETVIKELFGEAGLRVAYGLFGVVLILLGLWLM